MDSQNTKKKAPKIGLVITTVILAGAFLYLALLYPKRDSLAFQEGRCEFSKVFHLYCPGCGGTRAIQYLLHGKILSSLLSNPIPINTAVLVLRIWSALGHNVLFPKKKEWKIMHQWEMWGILVVVIGFFVLRNLALVFFGWDFTGDLAQYW